MATAHFVQDASRKFNGEAKLFRLDPPISIWDYDDEVCSTAEFVVVSATVTYSGPETYIFAADESGEVTSWSELDGSYRGGLSINTALCNAGYDIAREGNDGN